MDALKHGAEAVKASGLVLLATMFALSMWSIEFTLCVAIMLVAGQWFVDGSDKAINTLVGVAAGFACWLALSATSLMVIGGVSAISALGAAVMAYMVLGFAGNVLNK